MTFLTPPSSFLRFAILENLEVHYGLIELCSPLLPPPTLQPHLRLWDLDSFSTLRWTGECLFLYDSCLLFIPLLGCVVRAYNTNTQRSRNRWVTTISGHLICITSSKTTRPRECNSVPQATITRHTCHQQTISWVSPSILLLSETFDAEGFSLGSQIMEEKYNLLYGSFSLWVSINCQVYENPNLMITQTKKKILTALFGSLCCFLFPERPDLFKARLDNQGRPLSIYFTFSLIVMNWAKQ